MSAFKSIVAARRGVVTTVVTAITVVGLSACASIVHGTRQDVAIASSPSDAEVWIDGRSMGKTPLTEKLSRKTSHIVKIQLNGYAPYEATLTRSVSGWAWGNVLIGGLIGLAVDAASGGLYKLSPEQVEGKLTSAQASLRTKPDELYVAVVLKPEANWIKVGQLQRAVNGASR